ncbi:phage portal protein [Intestinibacter bartlettii]|uniref:phage portal protein n=1 Tax=Intestinibacter bartlettii TaxID=261299 RepID=UPI001106D885|nr:phage portal protein [Intestinibacter bartlettii]
MLNSYQEFVTAELAGLYGSAVLQEMNDILRLYDIYEGRENFIDKSEEKDYTQTEKRTNLIKKLIKEESRFLFGKTPELYIQPKNDTDADKDKAGEINLYLNKILKDNLFSEKLVKGARDCFIGKRAAIKLYANQDTKEIRIMFLPSLEFIYESDEENPNELKKIIFFYQTNKEVERDKQRIWKQKYEMIDGRCILNEGIYNGNGILIEPINVDIDLQLSGIPCYVIINDGLSGDPFGESDVKELLDNQIQYNRLSSEDVDTLRKGMDRIIYGVDIDPEASEKFKLKPGAFWDVPTDPTAEGKQATLGTIPTDFGYGEKIESSLKRIKSDMYEMLNVPMLSNDELKGMMTSGKTMKALYWQLITRCEEKMMAWRPALEWLIRAILEITEVYQIEKLPQLDYTVTVENNYPLQEDEDEEKTLDLQQVNAQAMSRKTFIKKWQGVTDDVADAEIKQIALEREMLEESYVSGMSDSVE